MKRFLVKCGAFALVAVMCATALVACGGKNDKADGTENAQPTVVTTTAKKPAVTGSDRVTFEDLCEGMTEEEIQQVLKDLEDLGMTTDDLVNMLYEE